MLEAQVVPPICGDGLPQPPEQCDDANGVSGDGCTSCQLEATFVTETEPNGIATPNPIGAAKGAVGSIAPVGDQDFYSFDVAIPGSSVIIQTTNGIGGCPAGFDSVVTLMNAANTVIVTDDNNGVNNCSLINPQLYYQATNLAAGTYKVKVEEFQNNAVQPVYVLEVQVIPPACGDGFAQPPEQCDDGNMVNGDGCTSMCQLEGSFVTESEPNGIATPNALGAAQGAVASISPVADQDFFSFDIVVPSSSVVIKTSNGVGGCPAGFDSIVTLMNAANTVIVTDDNNGFNNCSLINPQLYFQATNLAAGTYKVKVEENGNNAVQAVYVLEVQAIPPACGDGFAQPGEQCDDGNLASGDGCSAICQLEAGSFMSEVEQNGVMTPNALAGFAGAVGSISPVGDIDHFSFDVAAPGASVVIVVSNGLGGCPPNFDSRVTLLGPGDVSIATDDNNGPVNCSQITPAVNPGAGNLAAGTYKVKVEENGNNAAQPVYVLTVTVTP